MRLALKKIDAECKIGGAAMVARVLKYTCFAASLVLLAKAGPEFVAMGKALLSQAPADAVAMAAETARTSSVGALIAGAGGVVFHLVEKLVRPTTSVARAMQALAR